LCITHLPQLAGFGDQHFKVEKVTAADRTVTRVSPLEGQARVGELALMLGGSGEKTLSSAEEILTLVQAAKNAVSSKTPAAARSRPGG
jgi:DNA repair protein RecN (Recombination protein N)